ncbi:MAG: SDR family oxidoreductase [Microthrixaceae bacterium]
MDGAAAESVASAIPTGIPLEAAVNDEAQVVAAFSDRFESEAGTVADMVVNNAGIACGSGYWPSRRSEDWRQTLDVNLTGTFIVSRVAAVAQGRAGGF